MVEQTTLKTLSLNNYILELLISLTVTLVILPTCSNLSYSLNFFFGVSKKQQIMVKRTAFAFSPLWDVDVCMNKKLKYFTHKTQMSRFPFRWGRQEKRTGLFAHVSPSTRKRYYLRGEIDRIVAVSKHNRRLSCLSNVLCVKNHFPCSRLLIFPKMKRVKRMNKGGDEWRTDWRLIFKSLTILRMRQYFQCRILC